MKAKFKGVSRRVLSTLLAMVLLLSTMTVGMIFADAATITSTGTTKVYFKPGKWDADGAWFCGYFWNSSASNNTWVKFDKLSEDSSTCVGTLASGTYDKVIFLRKNPANTGLDWNGVWNRVDNIDLQSGKNCFSITDLGAGSWSTYQLTSSATLAQSASTIKAGESVTFTPGISENTDYNDYKSVSYSVSPSTGVSTSGNEITFANTGSYTVTATVTYNAKGFTDITKTATTTATVTVNPSTDPTEATTTAPITTSTEWFLIGGSGGEGNLFGNWDTKNESYPLDQKGTGSVIYREVTVPTNKDIYFRYHNGKDQYSLSNKEELPLSTSPQSLLKESGKATKVKSSSANIRICINTSDGTTWYETVESTTAPTEATTAPPATKYYVAGKGFVNGDTAFKADEPLNEMTLVNGSNTLYSITFTDKPAPTNGEYRYKITPGWINNINSNMCEGCTLTTISSDSNNINIAYTQDVNSDITVFYDSIAKNTYVKVTPKSASNTITITKTGEGNVTVTKSDSTEVTSGDTLTTGEKFKVTATPTISGVTPNVTVTGAGTADAEGYYTAQSSNITVTVDFPKASLPAPTIENKTGALTPSVTTAVIEVTNITEYNSIGTVSFDLYKDGTKVTNPTYNAGQFTVSEAGTYKVKATTTASGYNTESDFSNEVVVKQITPKYAIGGSAIGDNTTSYSADRLVSNETETVGVYYYDIVVPSNAGQRWFRLYSNGETNYVYAPSGSADIPLPGSHTSSATAKDTTAYNNNSQKVFQIEMSDGNSIPGLYRIFVDQNGTTPKVWATRINNPHAITLTLPIENGNVTVDQADLSSVNEGTKVTITATAVDGFKVGEIKVAKTGETSTTVSVTDNGDGTYSFTMPGYDVTINATFTAKSQYTVNFSSADSNGSVYATVVDGAELSSGDKVYEGTQVKFTAAPNTNYAFNKWSGSDTSSTNPLTVTVNSDITLTASFKEDSGTELSNMYMLYNVNNNNPSAMTNYVSVYKKDGKVYATLPDTVIEMNKDIYFGLSSSTSYTGLYWQENKNISVTSTDTANLTANYQHYGLDNKNYYFGKMRITTDRVTGITVCLGELDENGNVLYPNYVVTPTLDTTAGDTYTVYAMDGTDRKGSSGDLGDTEIISGFKSQTGTSTYYNTYKAVTGSLIQVRTTLTSTAKTAGEYVKYFIVNGVVQEANDLGKGVYGLDYLIDGTELDNKGNNTIEVYPIYFNKNIEDAGDYITVYVDATELNGKWGNIVGAYAYYYKNGTNNNDGSYNTGTYPGVPMYLDNNGKYVTKIPKYAYDSNGQKILGFGGDANKPYPVSGVTFNNFCESTHHKSLTTNNSNLQTYDYDDFVKIAELGSYDTVEFEIKYRKATSNQKSLLENATGAPDKSGTTLSATDISGYGDRNGWEQLTDYDLNVINLIGTPLDSAQAKNPALRVISTGNQSTSVGSWSTVWYVFDSDGNYITQGNPSDFLPRPDDKTQTLQYSLISGNATYSSSPVLITYESEMNAKTSVAENTGIRVDGRWYYATSQGVNYTIDVATQYRDSADSTTWTTADANHVLYGKATIDGVTSKTFTERNIPAELVASPALTGYAFTEWVIVDDNGKEVKKLPLTTASGTITANDPIHIVARFTKLAQGSLVIRHSKYTGFDPAYSAFGGGADRLISVVVKDKSGNPIDGMTWKDSKSAIDFMLNYNTQGTIEITLSTICHGMNTFVDFYEVLANDTVSVVFPDDTDHRGETGRINCKWTVNVADLFSSDGTQQLVSSLTYMSDVAPVTADAVLNYNYLDRFGNTKTYVKKVKLDDAYLNAYGMTVTDALIYQYAPAIDDLFKDCKWVLANETQVSKVGVTATIWATQVEKMHNVTYINADGLETLISGVTHNTHLTVDNAYKYDPQKGTMLVAPATNSEGKPFSYWLVTIKEGDKDKEVAKCYTLKFGLVILDDYTITPVYGEVVDSVTIGDPKFSREQSTNADGSIVTDVLYADFVVAFMDSKYTQLNTTLPTDEIQYRSGVLVEVAQEAALTVTDGKITNPEAASTITFDSNTDELQRIALTGANGSYKQGTYGRKVFNQTVNNSDYNNFNRVDVFFTFNNTVSNQKYVMKAYYYVYQVDANGNFIDGSFKMTDGSLYFNLYNIGNSSVSTDKPSA